MAATQRDRENGWKGKTRLGEHRCLDAKRCNDGESDGEYGQEDCKALASSLLEPFRSRVYRSHAAVHNEHCIRQFG